MKKTIEHEVGKYCGHPVTIRLANMREDDAYEIAQRLATQLGNLFSDRYGYRETSSNLESKSQVVTGDRVMSMSAINRQIDSLLK